jgi:hypothetical protein
MITRPTDNQMIAQTIPTTTNQTGGPDGSIRFQEVFTDVAYPVFGVLNMNGDIPHIQV